jgi:hypothetical protein
VTIYPSPSPVKTSGTPFRDSFADAVVNPSLWTITQGAGAISESAGTLTLGSGTTANNTTSLLSTQTFSFPAKVAIGLLLSQRIANQSFFVELVSIDAGTGEPNGLETAAFVFDGTTAAQAKHHVTTGALPLNQSAASTYPSTDTTTKLFEIEASTDEVWFHGSGALDQVSARLNSYRMQLKSPNPNAIYKLRLRWLNGATAPASNTNALVTFLSVIEYEELVTEILSGRGNSIAGNAVSVMVAGGTVTSSGTTSNTPLFPATGAPTVSATWPAAAVALKTSAARLYGISAYNSTAATRYLRLFNKASAPTLGTDIPVMVVAIPAGSSKEITLHGVSFSLGIGIAVTTDAAQLASTLATAGDVQASINYA